MGGPVTLAAGRLNDRAAHLEAPSLLTFSLQFVVCARFACDVLSFMVQAWTSIVDLVRSCHV